MRRQAADALGASRSCCGSLDCWRSEQRDEVGDLDRVSTMSDLNDGRAVAAVRYFDKAPDDPLEGKRTRLEFFASGSRVVLTQNC